MRVHCVGVGSIGSLVAFHLRRCNPVPNHDFSLILRKQPGRRTHPAAPPDPKHIYVESNGIRRRIGGFDVEMLDPAKETLLQVPIGQGSINTPRAPHLPPLPSFPAIKGMEKLPTIQSLVVTNKAGTTLLALQALRSRLNASSTVVLLQNGMGVYDHVVDKLFPDPDTRPNFILASTTHGSWSKRPLDVVHAGVGNVQFALMSDPFKRRDFEAGMLAGQQNPGSSSIYDPSSDLRVNSISTAITRDDDPKFYSLAETTRTLLRAHNDLGVSWVPMAEMEVVMRRKLAINACIGPITALSDCPNGALYGNASAHRLIRSVCTEAADVFARQAEEAAAQGRPVSSLWTTSLTRKALEESVVSVIRSTSRNFSSMLMDVRNGKVTEIEYINGYLSRMANSLGISVPTNQMLVEVIRMKRSIPSAKYSHQ